ncbi:MAG TPA: hypothetical protein VLA92_00195 [Candidatus Saccharimonadales bacterium]|nr:hypothetical protein [Candidatus Saccharimonadales bacterium]
MERNPYSSSEDAESTSSNKDKKSEGFRVAPFPIPGLAENKYRVAPRPEQHRPAAPLEGIISWREQDEMKHDIIKHDEGTREKKDEDQERDDEEHETKPVSKEYIPPVPPQRQSPRPLSEIIAEQQYPVKEQTKDEDETDSDEKDEEAPQKGDRHLPEPNFSEAVPIAQEDEKLLASEGTEEDAQPHLPKLSFTPQQRLAGFPPVIPRAEYQQPAQPSSEAAQETLDADDEPPVPAGAVHQTLPMQGPGVAEQAAWIDPEAPDDNQNTQNQTQPQFAQAFPPAPQVSGVNNLNQAPQINPNNQNIPINPAAWNQLPANPNAPLPVNGMAATGNGNAALPNNPNNLGMYGGNMGGNQPPAAPGYPNQQPFDPNNPAFGYNQAPGFNTQLTAPVMPLEHPRDTYIHNRDPRVGTVAAALGLEYFARKRADRKLEKRINKRVDEQQRKHDKQMQSDRLLDRRRDRQFEAEQQRQADELNRMRQTQPAQEYSNYQNTSGSEYAQPNQQQQPLETAPPIAAAGAMYANAAPSQIQSQANRSGAPMTPGQNQNAMRQEGVPMQQHQFGEQRMQPGQQQMAESAEPQDFDTQKARVEQSSWHNIVVDEHGREVAGAMQYGEGFKRERQQEIISDQAGDSFTPGSRQHAVSGAAGSAGSANAFAGGTVTGGQGIPTQVVYDQYGNPVQMQSLPSGMTNPSLPAGHPTHVDPQHQLEPTFRQPSNMTNPWFWLMLLLIIAAFFTAAFV